MRGKEPNLVEGDVGDARLFRGGTDGVLHAVVS